LAGLHFTSEADFFSFGSTNGSFGKAGAVLVPRLAKQLSQQTKANKKTKMPFFLLS
jgi:hypothetical protein